MAKILGLVKCQLLTAKPVRSADRGEYITHTWLGSKWNKGQYVAENPRTLVST